MATQVQFRGGTTTEHASFNGAAREVTVDTTKQTLVVQDGSTNGGFPLLGEKNADDVKVYFGTGNDLELFHDGSHSYINNHTGNLSVSGSLVGFMNAGNSEWTVKSTANDSVVLYYDGAPKLTTKNYGVTATGHFELDGANLFKGPDNAKLNLGNGDDIQVFHNGTNSYIQNQTGNLVIAANRDSDTGGDIWIDALNGERSIKCVHNAQVELYYNGSGPKFETTSEGTSTTGRATITYTGNAGKPTLTLGANNNQGSTSLTDSTSKGARVGVYHYTNAEEPAAIFYAVGSDTTNQVNYGGGTSYMNAATHHKFFTADDITTTSGTEKLRIDGNGRVSINTTDPHCANKGVHIKTSDSGVTSASTNRDDIFIEGNDHTGITIATPTNKTGGIGFDDPDGQGRGRLQYSHSSEKMQLYTSGTNSFEFTDDLNILNGNLKVASGHGIDFSANSNATGHTSNLLDDYESGTWTATVVTGTCSQQSCKYIKIGNQCTVWGRIHGLSDHTTNAVLKIEGLPYGCNISAAAGNKFSKDISTDANCTYITTAEQLMFYGHNSGNAWTYVTHLSCGSDTEIYFYGTYRTEYPGSN